MKKISKYKMPIFILVFLVVIGLVVYNVTNNKHSYAIEDKIEIPNSLKVDNLGNSILSEDVKNAKGVSVNKLYGNNNQVFSFKVEDKYGDNYSKQEVIKDKGLIYILSNSYPTKDIRDENGNVLDSNFQTWITQASIWVYLNEKGLYKDLDSNIINNIKNCKKLYSGDKVLEEKEGIYNKYIKDLVDNASKINTEDEYVKVFKEDKIYSTNDNKYYQSSEINVITNKSDSFKKYVISAPEGVKIVDSSGKEIDDNTLVDVTDSFYVRVPKNDINKNKTFTIKVKGIFDKYEGYIYSENGYNDVIYGGRFDYVVDSDFDIKF